MCFCSIPSENFHRTLTPPQGDIGGYPIPQYRKKNWQIMKYRVENRQNTDTIFMIGNAYLKFYPSRVFVCLKHLCTSNQPQPLRGNVRLPRTDQNDQKGCPTNFIHQRLTDRNCVIIYY